MFIDSRRLQDSKVIDADICIIGGGAAGITIARRFISSSVRVCLLESGGLHFDKATQSLYEGYSAGVEYELDATRTRFFGGSTNCWGGFCRPIDEYHFRKREWIQNSGWSFTKATLDPFYERAFEVCGMKSEELSVDYWRRQKTEGKMSFLPLKGDALSTNIVKINRDNRRFGLVARDDIRRSRNVNVYLYANATRINVGDFGHQVETVDVRTLSGVRISVKSKVFIVASGGIENARILLFSNTVKANGIGNDYDMVGRYFMEHAAFPIGKVQADIGLHKYLVHDTSYAYRRLPVGAEIRVAFALQKKKRILDSVTFLNAVVEGEESRGADSTKEAYTRLRKGDYSAGTLGHLLGAASDPINTMKFCRNSVFPSPGSFKYGILTTVVEPTPNPESRIVLSNEKDQLGVNRVCLSWRPGSLESETIAQVKRIFEAELPKCGVGAVEPWTEKDDAGPPYFHRWCWHHMGTTRMHDDPKQGVVDRNCRVHGMTNLFVAGSSVFPTGGYNTPTLTIIALALRLADHVEAQLENEAVSLVHCARVA